MRPILALCLLCAARLPTAHATSVIFIHPDGAGVAAWQAARFFWVGPDADLHWDKLPHIAIYRGHLSDSLTATSNGGGTTHAYGVKTSAKSFGSTGESAARPIAGSGEKESLMHEAIRKGLRTALINSGSIVEPGTAAYVASVARRSESEEIALQVVESGVEIILSGGRGVAAAERGAGTSWCGQADRREGFDRGGKGGRVCGGL